MRTPERSGRGRGGTRWLAPGISVAGGVAYLVAGLAGGDTWFAWFGFALMVVFAVVLLVLGRTSETVEGLLSRRDERINALDRDASLLAGMAVLVAVLVMFVVEVARGQDGSPYYQLAALGGVTYLVALVVLRLTR